MRSPWSSRAGSPRATRIGVLAAGLSSAAIAHSTYRKTAVRPPAYWPLQGNVACGLSKARLTRVSSRTRLACRRSARPGFEACVAYVRKCSGRRRRMVRTADTEQASPSQHAGSADATSCPSSTAPSRRRVARSSLSEPVPAITSRASAYTTVCQRRPSSDRRYSRIMCSLRVRCRPCIETARPRNCSSTTTGRPLVCRVLLSSGEAGLQAGGVQTVSQTVEPSTSSSPSVRSACTASSTLRARVAERKGIAPVSPNGPAAADELRRASHLCNAQLASFG
eukprot:scaffold78641_cov74-Phaeocystis_antarctica.AAC.6